MKITKIEKKKRLYLLEIDKKESLYVTEDTIVKYMLTKEMILDKDQLEDIKSFAQFSHGKNLALYFISFKQRSEKEVKDYLFKHEINPHIIPKIIDNLKKEHKKARHLPYAYKFMNTAKKSDDKEPSGTAGMPIYTVLEKNNLNL